jgi:exodeoxyribonuclease V beta subunit
VSGDGDIAYWPRPAALASLADGPATRYLVVEASAGTGKTFFLEHRVVDLIILGGARIDQVLVVTFTEKATAELKQRVRDLLMRIAAAPPGPAPDRDGPVWRIDADVRQRLRDAVASFDRAPISTIHGFCQRLLVEDAFAGRRLFDQTQIADEVAFDEAYRAALRCELAVDPRHRMLLFAWLASGCTVEQLRDVLLACARAAAPITPPYRPASLAAAAAAARAALAPFDAMGGVGCNVGGGLGAIHASTKNAVIGHLETVWETLQLVPTSGGDELIAASALGRFRGKPQAEAIKYLREKATGGKVPGPGATDAATGALAAVHALLDALVPLDAACAQQFLPVIEERLRSGKHRRGQFDFQDMLRLVAETLAGPRGGELATRLRRRHPWALIDEFQDTDDLQWSIFRTVWMPRPDEGDEATRGLTVVGDPKQAISSFRGADVYTYLGAVEAMHAAGAVRIPLTENRRSSPALVEAVNRMLAPRDDGAGDAAFFTGAIGYPEPVQAASAVGVVDGAGRVPAPITVLELTAADGEKEPPRAAIVERIADEIAALLGDPQRALTMTDVKHGVRTEKRLDAGDIFVLTRTNADSDEVATVLRARGLPCAMFQREHLFDSPEAAEVADLLEAIAAPRDRSARLRAWSTAFFDVPLDELPDLAELPDDHPLLARLFEWRALAARMEYERLFTRIIDDSRLALRALVLGRGERVIGNVQHVLELLLDEVARSRCEVHELARRLRGWIADGTLDRPDDVDVQRIETDARAIQIMTIHRAKGLEAPVVFVLSGFNSSPARPVNAYHDDERQRRLHVGALDGAAKERIGAETAEENERLCYVALTRAKVCMYLPLAKVQKGAPYAPIQRTLAALDRDSEAVKRGFAWEPVLGKVAAAPLRLVGGGLGGFVVEPPPPDGAAVVVPAPQRGFAVTSYTRMKQLAVKGPGAHGDALATVELSRDELRGDAADAVMPLAPTELPGGADTGVFLHEVLENVDFASAAAERDPAAWAAQPAVAEVFAAAARAHDIAREHLPHAHRLVHGALVQELALGGGRHRLCDADPARTAKEVEFVYPVPVAEGAPGRGFVKGFIDLLVEWNGELWVVDYKSDILTGFGALAAREHAAAHYDVQMKLYGLAAARMLGIDRPELMGRLGGLAFWFLRSGLVVDHRPTWDDLVSWQAWLAAQEVL